MTALYSNVDMHTKYVLVDQKMALAFNSCLSVFTGPGLLLGSLSALFTNTCCLHSVNATETEENNNTLSHRNINISQLETNCSRVLPDASKLNETRQDMCLNKCLMLDYMV